MATAELIDHETELQSLLWDEESVSNDTRIYQLSPMVLQSLEIALQQVRDGQTIPGDVVRRKIDEWLGTDDD